MALYLFNWCWSMDAVTNFRPRPHFSLPPLKQHLPISFPFVKAICNIIVTFKLSAAFNCSCMKEWTKQLAYISTFAILIQIPTEVVWALLLAMIVKFRAVLVRAQNICRCNFAWEKLFRLRIDSKIPAAFETDVNFSSSHIPQHGRF